MTSESVKRDNELKKIQGKLLYYCRTKKSGLKKLVILFDTDPSMLTPRKVFWALTLIRVTLEKKLQLLFKTILHHDNLTEED